MDWKGLGYIISIVSVLLIGAVAWPHANEPRWHGYLLIAGMATSIIGMGFRYIAHLKEKAEIREAKAEARIPAQRRDDGRLRSGEPLD